MSTRTDVHSPANLVTEDYEYLFAADTGGEVGWARDLDREFLRELTNFGPDDPHAMTNKCSHCGASLRYVAFLRHIPTGYTITVGETCLENRFERASSDFHALRKQAQLDREQQRIVNLRNEWFEADPARREAFEWAAAQVDADTYSWSGIFDFVHRVKRFGSTSDKFVAAILNSRARDAQFAAERVAREAAEAEINWIPVPTGRYEIEGVILSAKWKESDWGANLKILVQVDTPEGSFKVYGNSPRDFLRTSDWNEDIGKWVESHQVERGDRVRFTATVAQASWSDDESFGSFKIPKRASILKTEEAAS